MTQTQYGCKQARAFTSNTPYPSKRLQFRVRFSTIYFKKIGVNRAKDAESAHFARTIEKMNTQDQKKMSLPLLLIDAVCLAVALTGAYFALRAGLAFMREYDGASIRTYILLLSFSFLLVSFLQPPTKQLLSERYTRELVRIVRFNLLLTALFAAVLVLFKSPLMDSRYLLGFTIIFNLTLESLSHYFYKKIVLRAYADGDRARLIGIVVNVDRAEEMVKSVRTDYTRKLKSLILLDAESMTDVPEKLRKLPVSIGKDGLTDIIRGAALDEMLICLDYHELERMEEQIDEIKSMGILVHLYVPMVDSYPGAERTVEMIGNCPVVTIAVKTLDPGALAVKRVLDAVLGGVGLLISVPIILLVAGPLLLESKGPLFFSQFRVGRNGRVFRIYKLRSMYADAEAHRSELMEQNEMNGPMFKMKADPRITRVGRFIRKTSIDELPQLFNVVKGDMSLVGPRPPMMDEFNQYESRFKRRLSMRPGITGFWQVNGRNTVPEFEEVLKMDLAYIDNWSLGLDLKILIKTVGAVLSLSGR